MYKITDMHPPGLLASWATAVNVHGVSLLNAEWPEGGASTAFVYKSGRHSNTGLFDASDINRYIQVVGNGRYGGILDGDLPSNTFLFDNDQLSLLDLPRQGLVFAINDPGQVVGAIEGDKGGYQPFLYENNQSVTLDVPGGYATAIDINASGQIIISQNLSHQTYSINAEQLTREGWVDTADDATQTSGYLYSGGKLTPLGTLGGKYINPMGVNASGLIVGWSSLPSGDFHACLLDRGKLSDLGSLYDDPASIATAINAADTVVGISFGEVTRPFVWNLNVGMQDLNDLVSDSDWFLESVNDINDSGQIVGAGFHTLHGPKNVKVIEYRAFLLTPEESEQRAASEDLAGAAYFAQVLAGILTDSAGWYIGPDGQPHYQGPAGPGDPGGAVFQGMSASARDAVLGLVVSQVAPLINREEPRERIRRAALDLLNQTVQEVSSGLKQPVNARRPSPPPLARQLSKFGKLKSLGTRSREGRP